MLKFVASFAQSPVDLSSHIARRSSTLAQQHDGGPETALLDKAFSRMAWRACYVESVARRGRQIAWLCEIHQELWGNFTVERSSREPRVLPGGKSEPRDVSK